MISDVQLVKPLLNEPNGEVAIGVVDERGEAAVRVDLRVFRPLVLTCVDVDWDDVILEPKLFEDYSDFPVVLVSMQSTFYGAGKSL